ncbi:MAG: Ig-like domain-containing protein [Holophagales bacterium]|nr:Ig-like domain-containing protein [Holophagales bacterium]
MIGSLACSGGGDYYVAVTGVTLPESVGINCGESWTLVAQVQPGNATNKALTWVSSDTALAEVSGGSVKMKGIGEAIITATTQEGSYTASCTASTRLGSEERTRDAEYAQLSGPVNIDRTIIEVKGWDDFSRLMEFGYAMYNHTARGSDFVLSPSVTDPVLRETLAKEVERGNAAFAYKWEHGFRHGANAKHVWNIKKPENSWKMHFLDEVTANLAAIIIFRRNMLEEYKKQFQFSAWQYNRFLQFNPTSATRSRMMDWWDDKNDFADLMERVSPEEAALLVSLSFDYFESLYDKNQQNYRSDINAWSFSGRYFGWGGDIFITCSCDEEPFFQTALKALFTYTIDDKEVSLLDTKSVEDRDAFVARLNKKMNDEYDLWKSGFRVSILMPANPNTAPINPTTAPRHEYLLALAKAGKVRG